MDRWRSPWMEGAYRLTLNGAKRSWPSRALLRAGDRVEIVPGAHGNYGYVRFGADIEIEAVLGSRATNSVAGPGGQGTRPRG
jgi:allophanate hydrolase subunit 2